MARATTEIEKPAAPGALAEEEFEITLPKDDEERSIRLEEEPEAEPPKKEPAKEEAKAPEAKKAEEPAKEPAKEAPKAEAKPEPTPEDAAKEREALLARAREERGKRKEYARRYQDTLSELDRAREQLAKERAKPRDDGDKRAEAYWKQRVAELKVEADKADGMGTLVEMTLNEVWKEQERRDRVHAKRQEQFEYLTTVAIAQVQSRQRHPDYDEVLKKSGVQAAIQVGEDGNWKDPVLGRAVYFTRDGELRTDPAERAYEVAEALLKGKKAFDEELAGDDKETAKPEPKAEAKPEQKPEPTPEVKAEAEAERRGAQRVIDKVEAAANRPVGIRGIRPAGTPGRGVITLKELDRLADENPAELDRVLRANPELERKWLGG